MSRDSLFKQQAPISNEAPTPFRTPEDVEVAKAFTEALLHKGPEYQLTSLSALGRKFEEAGAGAQFKAWLHHEPATVSPKQLQDALGPQLISDVCERVGQDQQACLSRLTYVVPAVLSEVAPFELAESSRAFQFNLRELLKRLR